jgi:protein ImuB
MDLGPVPDSLLLDITGCAPLFGGEAALAEQLLKTLQTQGLRAQVAISATVATAFAFAHPGGHFLQTATHRRSTQPRGAAAHSAEWDLPVIVIPPGQADTWLHNLPIAAARIPLADAAVLAQLGILSLKQLLGLPFDDLPARISAVAMERLRQIRGLDEELITAIPEANPVSATWVSEHPATSHGEVRQVLEHLIEDIVQQLHRRRVATMRLSCQLKPQTGPSTALIGEVVKPVQAADQLKDVLFLKLEAVRLSQPVFCVTMRAHTAALPMARQQDLFSRSEHIEPAEELATVINRLSNRLGTQAVLTADLTTSPVPETSVQVKPVIAAGRAGRNIDHRLSDLVTPDPDAARPVPAFNVPLKLLPCPVLIAQPERDVLTQGFLWNGQTFCVIQATGPDRLQTHWWHDVAVHRDYYRVTTQVGAEFWLFKDLVNSQWYLHGVFE